MAITSAMEATFAIFNEDGTNHLGYLKISNGTGHNQLFWTTLTITRAQDDYGIGKQEGNTVFMCPGQTPADEHIMMSHHTPDCSKLYGFSLLGFDTEQIYSLDVNTRITTKFKAKCKFIS